MLIYKKLNNNAIISKDENHKEIVVMGKGIAFKKDIYDEVDEELITGIYALKSKNQQSKLQQLASEIPYEFFAIASDITMNAKKILESELDEGLLLHLADHLHYSYEKDKKGIKTPNLMLNEIKQFYKKEFEIGTAAVGLVNRKLGTRLGEDEAGFIAFHIVSCESTSGTIDANDLLIKMQKIIKAFEKYLHVTLDKESYEYSRFIIHLKFFMTKMITSTSRNDKSLSDDSLYQMLVEKYKNINECLDKISAITLLDFNYELTDTDRMYLIIHLARLVNK